MLLQPLFVIRGYADLLLTQLPALSPADARPALAAIAEKTSEAAALVDDILLASRLASGEAEVDLARVELGSLAEEVAARAGPRASLAAGEVSTRLPAKPVVVNADVGCLTRILDNLVTNAIIYSKAAAGGGPQAGRYNSAAAGQRHRQGHPADMHDRIFDRFVGVEDHAKRPGSGLGLYISRQLAERQGASLRLGWSELGKGSTFCLSYPRLAGAGINGAAGRRRPPA